MKWERRDRELPWPNLKYYLGNSLEGLRKTIKTSVMIFGLMAGTFKTRNRRTSS
jgi:hypothetical protein